MKKDDRWPFDPGKAAALRKQLKDAQAEIVCAARDTLTNLGLQLTSHARSLRNEDDDHNSVMVLVPGGGLADVQPTEEIDLVPTGLWSTAKFALDRGLAVASMSRYVSWALNVGESTSSMSASSNGKCSGPACAALKVRPVVLRCHTPEAITSAIMDIEAVAKSSSRRLPRVVIVAHSEGGVGVLRALREHPKWLVRDSGDEIGVEVVGVALLDSVHASRDLPPAGSVAADYLLSGAVVNWLSSAAPLDDTQPKPWARGGVLGGTQVRSAGGTDHLTVPSSACDSVCAFLADRLARE